MRARSVEARIRSFAKATLQRASIHLPSRAALSQSPTARLYGVYRSKNAACMARLLDQLGPAVTPALHALDAEHPLLSSWTVSAGPGARMPLLQALIDAAPPSPEEYVVVADDDVTFVGSAGADFLPIVCTAGFDLAQPAHAPGSNRTYRHLEVALATTARRVGFVEVGPLLVMSPRGRRHLLPFPAAAQMGWGVDINWSVQALKSGLRLGVVDATPMRHEGPLWAAYGKEAEYLLLDETLAQAGLTCSDEFMVTVPPRWRPWHRSAPWLSAQQPRSSG